MSAAKIIAAYQALVGITHKMRGSATAGDWDAVLQLEAKRVEIIETLKEFDSLSQLDPADAEMKNGLLQEIISADQEIRREAGEAMQALSAALGSSRHARRAIRAYGA